jgi:hypothetical protein
MRDLTTITTLKELFEKKPTLTEATRYFTKWYKDRKADYGDYWRNKDEMKKLAKHYLERFMKVYKDKEMHALCLTIEKEFKEQWKEEYNPFQHAEYIYNRAIRYMKEWDEMVSELEKMII